MLAGGHLKRGNVLRRDTCRSVQGAAFGRDPQWHFEPCFITLTARGKAPMKLIANIVDGHSIDIRPAPVERDWMDKIDQRFAYRCLPLSIANAHGWEILCATTFTAVWDGGPSLHAVTVTAGEGQIAPALSHFGFGVLTFYVPCLFRTEAGFDLMVSGPINRPKDAIAPLTGSIETEWSPYSFTMNWQFTRPQTTVRFEKGEPFCHIMPVRQGEIESVEPEFRLLSDNPELKRQHDIWTANRNRFNVDLLQPGSDAQAAKWQKLYHRGLAPDGETVGSADHRTRLKAKPFKKRGIS